MYHPSEVTDVLERVNDWPAESRLSLAEGILRSLQKDIVSRAARRGSLRDLVGLLSNEGPPPTDEECRQMLEEELLKKYGT